MSALMTMILLAALPVPKSAAEIESQLVSKGEPELIEALENVAKACRGSLRLVLRDHAGVIAKVDGAAKDGSPKVKKAVLGAARCFRPAAFSGTFARLIGDADQTVAAFALEIASNTRDVALAPIVLDAEAARADKCLDDKLDKDTLEACVWAAYAPSTLLDAAPAPLKAKAAELAVKMLEAPSPKIREVAVESLAATKLAVNAPALAAMIEKEKSKGFSTPNDAALVKRFETRLKALKGG